MVDADVHIVLVGPMGAGKTTVGRALADTLDRAFLDSDDVVEAARGRTGARIADELGTVRLHEIELSALTDMLASRPGAVIAAAASALDDASGRDLVSGQLVIWLDADDDVLSDRREHGAHRRRIDADEARRLRETRRPHYASCATGRVDTSTDVATSVARALGLVTGSGGRDLPAV